MTGHRMIVATAGQVDHGKTSLVRALTGIDTDRLPEEKARGISIDIGFVYWGPFVFSAITGGAQSQHWRGGTYTANMVALSAAHVTLDILTQTDALKTIDRVGLQIKALLGRVFI